MNISNITRSLSRFKPTISPAADAQRFKELKTKNLRFIKRLHHYFDDF